MTFMNQTVPLRCRSPYGLPAAALLLAAIASGNPARAAWPPAGGLPITRWAKDVSPDRAVLPEYPRPQMVRQSWLNLNGLWDYAITPKEAVAPGKYQGKILVPFPPQAVLSQVNQALDDKQSVWYHRILEIPSEWSGQQVLLNFGAVNWEAHVEVNGKIVGTHTGGYDSFTCDITHALRPSAGRILSSGRGIPWKAVSRMASSR